MNKTTVPAEVMQAEILKDSYHHARMVAVKAALLRLAIQFDHFNASQIDAALELREDGSHDPAISGTCTAALLAIGLIQPTGNRVRSSRREANGRKVNELRLAPGRMVAALAWFRENAQQAPCGQQEMAL